MGNQITKLFKTEPIEIEALKGKVLAVDAYNIIYQFLSTIRQRDGTPLTNSKGNITSHVSGIFFRMGNLLDKGLKLIFVFDGKAPELKAEERQKRMQQKEKAKEAYDQAVKEQNINDMKKYGSRLARMTPQIKEECIELLEAMGIPCIQAPSEGEAQAAYMQGKGDVYAIISQDADAFLFGATKVIRNLTISQKRKIPGTAMYKEVKPEIYTLSDNLNNLGIDKDQLIAMALLTGTDFNNGGIPGIGPHKALKLIKTHKKDFETLFKNVEWEEHFEYAWKDVFEIFTKIPTTDKYNKTCKEPDREKIEKIMFEKHEFSEDRIKKLLDKMCKGKAKEQKSLFDY